MSCCCSKILELCRVNVCSTGSIVTGALAPAAGEYKLVLNYLDIDVVKTVELAEEDPINFDVFGLNEDYHYTGHVYSPAGELVTFLLDETVYDCIGFKTTLAFLLPPEEEIIT